MWLLSLKAVMALYRTMLRKPLETAYHATEGRRRLHKSLSKSLSMLIDAELTWLISS